MIELLNKTISIKSYWPGNQFIVPHIHPAAKLIHDTAASLSKNKEALDIIFSIKIMKHNIQQCVNMLLQ